MEVAQLIDQALDEKDDKMVLRCVSVADSRVQPNQCTTSESVPFFSCFSASWIYSKVVSLGVSFLERENRSMCILKFLLQPHFIYTTETHMHRYIFMLWPTILAFSAL